MFQLRCSLAAWLVEVVRRFVLPSGSNYKYWLQSYVLDAISKHPLEVKNTAGLLNVKRA